MHPDADSDSQHSFDSSVQLNSLGSTSTASLAEIERPRQCQQPFNDPNIFFSGQNLTPIKQPNSMKVMKEESPFVVGFKKGWGGNNVLINESKLKKAKMFFDDTQELGQIQSYSLPAFNFPKRQKESLGNFQWEGNQHSVPCFKTVGTGIEVKISRQIQSKAKVLLSEFDSYKKPTKLKKGSNLADETYIKTVNNQWGNKEKSSLLMPESQKMGQPKQELARKSFNWEKYERQYREEIDRDRISSRKGKVNPHTSKKKRKPEGYLSYTNKELQLLKLASLELNSEEERVRSRLLAQESRLIYGKIFQHVKQKCLTFKCVLCSINYNSDSIDAKEIYHILNKEFAKKWVSYEDFQPLYHQVCFKLLKYQCFWPDLANKQCLPSNIIVQITKKLIKITANPETPLRKCFLKNQVGRKITVAVQQKYINHKMNIVFLKLSDGWSSVWAAIQSHNLLFKYLIDDDKVLVGTKLCICLWIIHPISNIMQFSSQTSSGQCIEIFYNGSIIMRPNSRLGFTPAEFYRPLDRCRQKGGLIPLVQGYVIRLFTIKERGKKTNQFSVHCAQVLTPEGFTQLIQFVLGEQSSLVEYFRLYRFYNFYRLKITQQGLLSFGMDSSKFEEVKICKINQRERIYPEPVMSLLCKRLINKHKENNLKNNHCYDVICNKGRVFLEGNCDMQIEVEENTIDQKGTILLQQFSFVAYIDGRLVFRKKKYSSQPKRLPPIYELINNHE